MVVQVPILCYPDLENPRAENREIEAFDESESYVWVSSL